VGSDQSRVATGDFGLGHRETTAGGALAQWSKIFFFLLIGRPVQQGVLVAFVGRLRVQHERTNSHFRRFCRHRRHRRRPQTHATPLGRHMRQPKIPFFSRRTSQLDDRAHDLGAIFLVDRIPSGAHLGVHELANLQSHGVDLGRE